MSDNIPIYRYEWQKHLHLSLALLLEQTEFQATMPSEHFKDTPKRVVAAFTEYFAGVHKDPAKELRTSFAESAYDQMIVVSEVDFVSWCAHHLCPFIGTYAFAYLPDKHIVGLSKIPRMIDVLCARPQVQEKLSQDIVEIFQKTVQPKGCGIIMDAVHTCACTRGVKKRFNTRTTALAGVFREPSTKQEFLMSVRSK